MHSLLTPSQFLWHTPFSLFSAGPELLWVCPNYTPAQCQIRWYDQLAQLWSFISKHPRGNHCNGSLHQFFLEKWIFSTFSSQCANLRTNPFPLIVVGKGQVETHWRLQTQCPMKGQNPCLKTPGESSLPTYSTDEWTIKRKTNIPSPDPRIFMALVVLFFALMGGLRKHRYRCTDSGGHVIWDATHFYF